MKKMGVTLEGVHTHTHTQGNLINNLRTKNLFALGIVYKKQSDYYVIGLFFCVLYQI